MEYNEENLSVISDLIRENLKKYRTEFIPGKWKTINTNVPMFGFCHTASGCLQKIFGSKALKTYRAKDETGTWHWWCVDNENKIIDLTSEQYTSEGRVPPYEDGEKYQTLGFQYRDRINYLYDKVMRDLGKSPGNVTRQQIFWERVWK